MADIKKSSRTPPPRAMIAGGAATGMENWVPWPDLDAASLATPRKEEEEDPLDALTKKSQKDLCR
jgi:hypothetical protein